MNLVIMLGVAAVVLWIDYEVQQAPLLNDLDPYPAHPEASDKTAIESPAAAREDQ